MAKVLNAVELNALDADAAFLRALGFRRVTDDGVLESLFAEYDYRDIDLADGADVTLWPDGSGNENDAVSSASAAASDPEYDPNGDSTGSSGGTFIPGVLFKWADSDGLDTPIAFDPSAQSFTVIVVLGNTNSAVQAILSQEDGTGTGRTILDSPGDGTFETFLGGSSLKSTTGPSPDGRMLSIRVDHTTGDITLRVDRTEEATATKVLEAADGIWRLGHHKLDQDYLAGSIAHVRVYNAALSIENLTAEEDELFGIHGIG